MLLFSKILVFIIAVTGSHATRCQTDMDNLLAVARADSTGKRPDGRCYSHVADYIDSTGYGGIAKGGFDDAIPSAYWAEAHDFADYLNKDNNAARLSLNIESIDNPYKAPAGSIVVVRAGTPGTSNPTAGDIAVVGESGHFYNGGEMGYGGSGNFPGSPPYVLGIYTPIKCASSGCPATCSTCVLGGGGKACVDRCTGCSSDCINCILGGGGTGCASRCAPSLISNKTQAIL